MTARTSLVKSSLLALGLGAALSTSGIANAQHIVYTAGGSSALQGTFTGTPSLGAIPQFIVGNTGSITGYSSGSNSGQGILTANVTINGAETGSTGALVCYTSDGTLANTNIIILVRSDSGYGVRYVANKESITSFTFTGTFTYSVTPAARAATALDTSVENYLTGHTPVRIYNGLSDVAGDTIATYSGFPSLTISGLSGAKHDLLPVQTLLFLYNKAHALGNVTRTQAKSLIGGLPGDSNGTTITWGQILGTTNTDPVAAYYRESTSGTRCTELLNVQRAGVITGTDSAPGGFASIITENQFGSGLQGSGNAVGSNYAVNGSNNANGTGAMINAVNNDTNGFGYAFVTGSAGANKANVEVASYDGVSPLDLAAFPKLSDGGQALPTYSSRATTYYTPIIYGIYELWAYANQIQAPDTTQSTVANQIVSLLDSSLNASTLHSLGFTRVSELKVTRVATQGVTVTDDNVTDGQLITFDSTANVAGNSGIFGGSQSVLQAIIE